MKRGAGALRHKAREAALRVLGTKDSQDFRHRLRKIELHSVLADTAELPDLPWVRKRLEREQQISFAELLGSLVRLAPEEGRARFKVALDRPKEQEPALYVLRHTFENSNEEEFSQILARLAQTAPAELLKSICRTLLSINSPSALREARAILPRLAPTERAWLTQRLDAPDFALVVQRVRDAGVIDDETANKLLAGAAANRSQRGGETSSSLFDVLGEAGILFGFDVESGAVPVRHDRFLLDLAALSQNRFKPLSVLEQWRAPIVEGIDGLYTLQFEHGGRLYTATLRDLGDWYDLERLISVANRALADSAIPQRYLLVDSGDQTAIVVCADPQRLRPLAKEFNLPLLDDPNAPREAGQEFERKVLDGIKP
jgi:hypothetical protein